MTIGTAFLILAAALYVVAGIFTRTQPDYKQNSQQNQGGLEPLEPGHSEQEPLLFNEYDADSNDGDVEQGLHGLAKNGTDAVLPESKKGQNGEETHQKPESVADGDDADIEKKQQEAVKSGTQKDQRKESSPPKLESETGADSNDVVSDEELQENLKSSADASLRDNQNDNRRKESSSEVPKDGPDVDDQDADVEEAEPVKNSNSNDVMFDHGAVKSGADANLHGNKNGQKAEESHQELKRAKTLSMEYESDWWPEIFFTCFLSDRPHFWHLKSH